MDKRLMVFSSDKKIKIDNQLYQEIQRLSEQQGYSSVDEFVKHVLERATKEFESKSDQAEVEKQLRGLGYIE